MGEANKGNNQKKFGLNTHFHQFFFFFSYQMSKKIVKCKIPLFVYNLEEYKLIYKKIYNQLKNL